MMTPKTVTGCVIAFVTTLGVLATLHAKPAEPAITSFEKQFCLREIEPNIRWDFELSVTETWDVSSDVPFLVDRHVQLDVTGTGQENSFSQEESYTLQTTDDEMWPAVPSGVCVNFLGAYPGPSSATLTYDERIYTNWRL